MKAAKSGDFAQLKAAIADRERAANLSNKEAADIAKVVASREVTAATKPEDAAARVRDLVACAYEVDDALDARMQTHDQAGAEAAIARLESAKLSDDDVRSYAGDENADWRAVGARALTRPEDERTRERLMQDANARVRREAVRAAARAHDAADLVELAEIARLDPEPMVRTEAVRAMAEQPSSPGHEEVANRLSDLWTNADDALREDIALAWASPEVYAFGGREALRMILGASNDGPGVMEAAAAIEMVWRSDAEIERLATARILAAVKGGTREARLHAIAIARLDDDKDTLEAIHKASKETDVEIKVAALARMVELPADQANAVQALEVVAGQERQRAHMPGMPADAAHQKVAARALFVLAQHGDVSVQKWIEDDLAAKDPYDRLAAASALAALGRSARAAPLLADDDAHVRAQAACTLLLAVRGR
jgi:hypothetical protein